MIEQTYKVVAQDATLSTQEKKDKALHYFESIVTNGAGVVGSALPWPESLIVTHLAPKVIDALAEKIVDGPPANLKDIGQLSGMGGA